MAKRKSTQCSRRAPKSSTRTFLEFARRELDAAPPRLNSAIAMYVELAPKIQTLSLFDLQLFAADMEDAARAGEQESSQIHEIVRALELLAPEPMTNASFGF
jgi:hypothetical protein